MTYFLRAAAIAALVSFVPACTTTGGKRAALAAGGMLAGGGLGILIYEGTRDKPENPFEEDFVGHGMFALAGIGLLVLGGALAVAGAASEPRDTATARATEPPPPPPVVPREARPLPERATDARSLQLAKQARRAALHLECAAVNIALDELEDRDAADAEAVIAAGVVAPCR
jgi:hypothetical protein